MPRNYTGWIGALLGGTLLWAAWPVSSFTFLLFLALVPLLWVEDHTSSTRRFLLLTYVHMLTWNVLTTWWVWNASALGAVMAFVANSAIMCLPWLGLRWTKRRLGRTAGYLSFIAYWIAFEYLHHNWELSWPWLTLGNGFALQPGWIQWYEYTGTTGGSLWVLATNLLLYSAVHRYRTEGRTRGYFLRLGAFGGLMVLPILLSRVIGSSRAAEFGEGTRRGSKNIVVVQPNVDPYEEKFAAGSLQGQVERLIQLSLRQVDSSTALVVWPETAIPYGLLENQIGQDFIYQPVWAFLQQHPQVALLTGINSFQSYGRNKKDATATARLDPGDSTYYDAFNTAALMRPGGNAEFYHKAKLVPGVETLPSFLLFLGSLFENFGGISGTLGRDPEAKVFRDAQHYYRPAPIICYESIYSDYVASYVRQGANVLTIITNDGWWDDTPGYRQHLSYARLRAIETRRWIARSANTGISAFLDPLGNVYEPQPWDTSSSIKKNIPALEGKTFFVRYGDYLGAGCSILTGIALTATLVLALRRRAARKKA
ncbi:MAG TPA: apolipoprotein N-acyltransferase [Chitinophagaceae bacterium]|nr:apolipoprotein N-acyltransferase [Chitinophagaceae bacterium]